MFGYSNDDLKKWQIATLIAVTCIIGWCVVEFTMWIFSHISFSWN